MRRSMLLAAGTVVLALVGAGCGDDDETPTATQDDPTTTTVADATSTTAADEPAPTVDLADSDLGEILVDGEGRTLYLFDRDTPGTSACADECATNWPPLAAPDELVAGDGVDEAMLGTITRDDGTEQVTYGDLPLYHFAGDSAPGDTNGQAVNDVWWVVGASGEPIVEAAAAPESGDAAGGAVTIQDFAFDPAGLEVAAGTAVTVTNEDGVAHTWTADDGAWDSGEVASGERFEHVFDEAGTFSYHCTLHPTMTGEVTVS